MLRDVEPFDGVWRTLRGDSRASEAVISFIRFLKTKLGAEVVYDMTDAPSPYSDLGDLLELAETMRSNGVLLSYARATHLPDEPPLSQWSTRYREGSEGHAGGSTVDDERHSFIAALAESQERYAWFETSDYFEKPIVATVRQLERRKVFVRPETFAGYSSEQRKQHSNLHITPESMYLWIRAESLGGKGSVWVPAQTISPHRDALRIVYTGAEPILRRAITTGLATHPMREEALLNGALEIIERDAYSIMWLNQLTLPRVDLDDLAKRRPSLRKLLNRCTRYRLRPHIVRMLTDAPTYAFCAVVEDETGNQPRVSVGLKCHRDPAACAEKAIIESLRARRGARNRLAVQSDTERKKNAQEVGHYDRLEYWANGDRDKKLSFLYAGPVQTLTQEPWELDDAAAHLQRIIRWCVDRGYQCVTVPLTKTRKNVTGWHIEMVVIPELQPLHYSESLPYIGGERLASVPKMNGYIPRKHPFTDEPHPFA